MTPDEAVAAAQAFLDREFADLALQAFYAEDFDTAYVCQHTTRKYLETRDPADAAGPGLGPIGVPKDGSAPWMLASGMPFGMQVMRKAAGQGLV